MAEAWGVLYRSSVTLPGCRQSLFRADGQTRLPTRPVVDRRRSHKTRNDEGVADQLATLLMIGSTPVENAIVSGANSFTALSAHQGSAVEFAYWDEEGSRMKRRRASRAEFSQSCRGWRSKEAVRIVSHRSTDFTSNEDQAPLRSDFTICSKALRCATSVASGPVNLKNQLASGPSAIAPSNIPFSISLAAAPPIGMPPEYLPVTSTINTVTSPTFSDVVLAVVGCPLGCVNCDAHRSAFDSGDPPWFGPK